MRKVELKWRKQSCGQCPLFIPPSHGKLDFLLDKIANAKMHFYNCLFLFFRPWGLIVVAKSMRIVSWNVNGIRAIAKKNFFESLKKLNADILCLQETKAEIGQVEPHLQSLGYSHFHWSSARRKGYSGVASFSNIKPQSIRLDFGFPEYQEEGRLVLSNYGSFELYNLYFPNGGSGEERHQFKQKFLYRLNDYLAERIKIQPNLIVLGDYNIAPKEIDVYDPERLSSVSGFLPEERKWFEQFFNLGFIDTFRKFHPEAKQRYSWWSYKELARIKNNGWRIDLISVSSAIERFLTGAEIHDDLMGSDHCPISIDLTDDLIHD
jgi:exodeoxyribonuclease-3